MLFVQVLANAFEQNVLSLSTFQQESSYLKQTEQILNSSKMKRSFHTFLVLAFKYAGPLKAFFFHFCSSALSFSNVDYVSLTQIPTNRDKKFFHPQRILMFNQNCEVD
eukprot:UN09681